MCSCVRVYKHTHTTHTTHMYIQDVTYILPLYAQTAHTNTHHQQSHTNTNSLICTHTHTQTRRKSEKVAGVRLRQISERGGSTGGRARTRWPRYRYTCNSNVRIRIRNGNTKTNTNTARELDCHVIKRTPFIRIRIRIC
jgi:hypothetical protein